MSGCFCGTDRDLKCKFLGRDSIWVFAESVASKGGAAECLIKTVRSGVINTFVVWFAVTFDGDVGSVGREAGSTVNFLEYIRHC